MEENRKLNMIFNKSGSGSPTVKLSIPISWCYRMDITENNKAVYVDYNDETKTITIKKAEK